MKPQLVALTAGFGAALALTSTIAASVAVRRAPAVRRATGRRAPRLAAHSPLLDERIAQHMGDGRPRTSAQLAAALGATPPAVSAGLARLAEQRRVRRSGYALPDQYGYAVPWPTLWGAVR
jgi:hypothetical protein